MKTICCKECGHPIEQKDVCKHLEENTFPYGWDWCNLKCCSCSYRSELRKECKDYE